MSQKDLKIYLKGLKKIQLEDQIIDLYKRFKDVKSYYDFAFNPKEDKLLEECKFKIKKEYFPENGRKSKARRSVAHKYIRKFIQLGVDEKIIADIMLFNVEIAQAFSIEKYIKQESFYISLLKSFEEAVIFIGEKGLIPDFQTRIEKIALFTKEQNWFNYNQFVKHSLNRAL
ncbi:MAG: hypothetical protein A2033_00605 [Bacteroidetes bacterium GWA2_31_9]|nr:MAG: hypothetical protein A2033_00605 [Bacteroidetes bacterium GWA2_31_9]